MLVITRYLYVSSVFTFDTKVAKNTYKTFNSAKKEIIKCGMNKMKLKN